MGKGYNYVSPPNTTEKSKNYKFLDVLALVYVVSTTYIIFRLIFESFLVAYEACKKLTNLQNLINNHKCIQIFFSK